jgi:hypothetical protein
MAGFTPTTFKFDDYMTPKEAWEDIKDYIPKNKIIWEPFYGDGNSGKYLRELGFNVIHEDIDFFENNKGDIIVTNPPFSKKKEVLKRLMELDKPFIIIMPVSTLAYKYTRELIGDNVQILVPKKRIQFLKLEDDKITNNGRCNFDCFYFCYKINLNRDILYLR